MNNSIALYSKDKTILIKDKYIVKISDRYDRKLVNEARIKIDTNGLNVQSGWIDSHLHIPGKLLYEMYGVDLQSGSSLSDYINILKSIKIKNKWLRGFGWSTFNINDEELRRLVEIINGLGKEVYIALFSSDYRSCILNDNLVRLSRAKGNVIKEKEVFEVLNNLDELSFSEKEIENAILKYQDVLLNYGITCVQTLMFLGGNGDKEYKVLKNLDEQDKLKIKVNIALTVQGYEDLSLIEDRWDKLKSYESEHIKLKTIKIYTDGVIENYTGYLSENYKDKDSKGFSLWYEEDLLRFCRDMDSKGRQIHIHAIGDKGVKIGAKALKYAMDTNNSIGLNRHVITHIQLIDKDDIKIMRDYKIIANMQPYWFGQDENEYRYSERFIGSRIEKEYPIKSLLDIGIKVACSSDSPVTPENNPLIGIEMGMNRYNKSERVSQESMEQGFLSNGAYQLFRENEIGTLDVGYKADIIGIRKDSNKLRFVITDGEIVHIADN